ncbi:MAG: 4-alpha-glucanotransferase [Lachnospiraceae bacterium]|nr:4-alpha-glucanotransferase [Lachnospiraceae bacterium]
MRESGILQPIFSLSSNYGIGCFSKEAYEFVDFLEKSETGFWQILPVGPTGFGNSPYQPFSAFAGNPYFISPEALIEEGLLTREEADSKHFGNDPLRVDYGALYENRFDLLRMAFTRFAEKVDVSGIRKKVLAAANKNGGAAAKKKVKKEELSLDAEYEEYLQSQWYWLNDYALFYAIKKQQGGNSWQDWEKGYKHREASFLKKAEEELGEEIDFAMFRQFEFDRQFRKLRAYANRKNVKIIGDLPFYVSLDSSDAWAHPEVFCMDKDLAPVSVAGCPPDAFSADGQLWGNPLYDWKALKKTGYDWWVDRIRRNYEFYDVIRLDHFHGFESYYAIPYGAKNAREGKIQKGPGMDLFQKLEEALSSYCVADLAGALPKKGEKAVLHLPMIAEDLGNNTPENEKLLADSGFPGMKVLQYAFTSWDSIYVTHKHVKNCVVYTGTHDNTPMRAWAEEISDGERTFARGYINSLNTDYGAFVWDMIREAYRSVADLCIVPLTDYLTKGKEARINMPGSGEGNWEWRLPPHFLSDDLAGSIAKMTELYGRVPVKKEQTEDTKE